ncbi:glycine cleavage system protein GcvH [Streptomyces sp. NPDC094437]|uniref:glycine cleavage system protein GcvH n=1 Tax=Streptomyces sp. NPDC094437 TaxID=3366060 RepID=UPI0037F54DE2
MANYPSDLRYTREHEWVRVTGEKATVGLTDFAQKQLGDVVFVELPVVDRQLARGEEFATVESVKAASEVYAPLSGSVTATNNGVLGDSPEEVNNEPYGEGWMIEIEFSDKSELDELLTADAYQKYVESEES